MNIEKLKINFRQKYDAEPRIFRAPGRVNLIGEHTDYNEGFVMPCAIDFATLVAGAAREDRKIRVASLNLEDEIEFDLDLPEVEIEKSWAKYVQGIAFLLEKSGRELSGANLLINSNVPIGSGLSSSAALEISIGLALSSLSNLAVEKWELAKIGQSAEHIYAGVRSGIMDQFASAFGVENHGLFLDCRTLEWSPIPLSSAKFLICNTKTKHDLADGEYNKRRAECEKAAKFFGCDSLRDVSFEEFIVEQDNLPEILRKRARHVITENQRVLKAVDALKNENLEEFGKLMNESHESLKTDYEVSSTELDLMVEIAREQKGILGARMTGGGFGGCTVNLFESGNLSEISEKISEKYHKETGILPEIYLCRAVQGASEII